MMLKYLSDILIVSGGVLGCFMSLSLAKSLFFRSQANNYLSFSILVLSVNMLLSWPDVNIGLVEMLQGIMWEFLVAVTLFAYFLIHLNHPFFFSKHFRLLYLPFAIILVIDIILVLLVLDISMGYYQFPQEEAHFPLIAFFFLLENWVAMLFTMALMGIARKLIHQSSIEISIKHWLLQLNTVIWGIIIIWFLEELEDILWDTINLSSLSWISIALLFWFILYYGVFKLQIAIQRKEIFQIRNSQKNILPKANKMSAKAPVLMSQLMDLMEKKAWYKNPLLGRQDLAKALAISEGYLSQLINQELNKPINQFINEYRIAEAKKMLENPTFYKYSLEAIGLEVGFKSRSTFYKIFKAHTGVSPGGFRKQNSLS